MLSRPLTIAALLLASTFSAALAGQKVTTPLLRIADPDGTARGSVQLKLKGEGSSVTIKVQKLDAEVPAPLGVFLDIGVEAPTFLQIASIETLTKGGGKITLSSTDGAPEALGVETLDDLAGRVIEVRDANGLPLLDAQLPGLQPFAGTKLVGKLLPPEGAPAPTASATISGKASNPKGSERFQLKAKKLPAGVTCELFLEDAPGSENFVSAGELDGSLFLRDTALGDRLPLELPAHADLVGRAIEVRDGSTVLLTGTIEEKGKPGLKFPLTGVIVMELGDGVVDRYLRVVGLSGPLYRSLTDLDEVSAQELAEGGDCLWRIDKIGQTANGPLVTVTLVGHEDTWWMSTNIGAEHYVHVNKQNVDPTELDYAHFILLMGSPVNGKPSFLIESAWYDGEYIVNQGHGLTANGVKLDGGGMTLELR